MLSNFLKVAQEVSSVRRQEVPLPIAKKVAIVSPLSVGDDVALRTSLVSPVNYDREIIKLIYNHTEIYNSDGKLFKEKLETFTSTISNIDKICLIWGLYKSTYDTLGTRIIRCDKENCKTEFKEDITLDSLIQEDSFVPWEESIPFYEYVYPIEIPYDKFIYLFESRIPSIRDNNSLLSTLSVDVLQHNLQTTGSVFSRAEQMTLLTKSITIATREGNNVQELSSTKNLQEILLAFKEYIPHVVSEGFFDLYTQKFDKYYPKFYTNLTCPGCNSPVRFEIDLEVEFFQRSLFGRREGRKEI